VRVGINVRMAELAHKLRVITSTPWFHNYVFLLHQGEPTKTTLGQLKSLFG